MAHAVARTGHHAGAHEPSMSGGRTPGSRAATAPRGLRRAEAGRVAATAALLLALPGCRAGWANLGESAARAQVNGVLVADALVKRYQSVERAPGYARARAAIGKHALDPSRVFDDTTLWTTRPDARTRELLAEGQTLEGRYRFGERAGAPLPDRLADARHLTRLVREGDEGAYLWQTQVDFAIGTMDADDLARGWRALLASLAGRDSAALRADLQGTLPRTVVAAGRLFSLDSIRPVTGADGATAITLGMTVRAERVQGTLPRLAAYVRKFVAPTAFRLVLRDGRGTRWADVALRDSRVVVRLRQKDGRLVALDGAPVPLPDSLEMVADFRTKFGVFGLGYRSLRGHFVEDGRPGERAWTMRFDREPTWELPPLAAQFLKTPLRHPFTRGGLVFRVAFRPGPNGQTLITRETRIPVMESPVTRFIGRWQGSAFSEFEGATEKEETQFNRELFAALREDLRSARFVP
jgi:hypothetical protein